MSVLLQEPGLDLQLKARINASGYPSVEVWHDGEMLFWDVGTHDDIRAALIARAKELVKVSVVMANWADVVEGAMK